MLLKKMTLINFRQFNGTQTIEFSTDPEKNVTVIMGENGSGKTTLAQAFTWCLYGDTDFDDKYVLNKKIAQSLGPNSEATVKVELSLKHAQLDYQVIREQKYTTDATGNLKKPNSPIFKIAYKAKDGQQEFVKDSETEVRMKEILPKELSKYFFFDGERIGNMSKEIRKGKSQEFAEAVKSLLGLSAFTSAMDHIGGRASNTVIKTYDNAFDAKSDSKIDDYKKRIQEYSDQIESIQKRLDEIEGEEEIAREKKDDFDRLIAANKDSEELSRRRTQLNSRLSSLKSSKETNTSGIVDVFNKKVTAWMSKKMICDALGELSAADKIDTGIPDIHARTIKYLMERKKCLCGQCIEFGNEAYLELTKVLDYIPPKSIGTLIGQFVRECELKEQGSSDLFDDVSTKYGVVRSFESDYGDVLAEIDRINEQLKGMQNVGELQQKYNFYATELRKLSAEKSQLNKDLGVKETEKGRIETEMNELVLKDDNNKRIARYKAYATYMYRYIYSIYTSKELETRELLQDTVNEIFKEIYNGGFSLAIDEKYNIQILVDDYEGFTGDVETSTAQSISVIFAFIAGVIKIARDNNKEDSSMLSTESYPLVMDAPLSAFDKTRIKTVCDALPKVAEQVIIFIKDTDGEIAEENMGNKVGMRYQFDKLNEFETELNAR